MDRRKFLATTACTPIAGIVAPRIATTHAEHSAFHKAWATYHYGPGWASPRQVYATRKEAMDAVDDERRKLRRNAREVRKTETNPRRRAV